MYKRQELSHSTAIYSPKFSPPKFYPVIFCVATRRHVATSTSAILDAHFLSFSDLLPGPLGLCSLQKEVIRAGRWGVKVCRKMGCRGLPDPRGGPSLLHTSRGCSTFPHPLNKRGPGDEKTPTITTVRTGLGPGQPRSEGGGATRGNPSSACAQELRYPGRRVNVYMLGNRAATSIARFKGSP